MPTPATGSGTDVSKGLRKFSWALYLSSASGAGVIPPAKLLANEPASPWVRQGRLNGDEFSWNIPDPTFLEGRAGFVNNLKYRVVKQAEPVELTVPLDESDPEVLNRLRGNAASSATSLSSGAYTGYSFIYKPGVFYAAKVLLVGSDVTGGVVERQIFAGNAYVTFKNVTRDTEEGVDVMITMAQDTSGNSYTMQEWA